MRLCLVPIQMMKSTATAKVVKVDRDAGEAAEAVAVAEDLVVVRVADLAADPGAETKATIAPTATWQTTTAIDRAAKPTATLPTTAAIKRRVRNRKQMVMRPRRNVADAADRGVEADLAKAEAQAATLTATRALTPERVNTDVIQFRRTARRHYCRLNNRS